MKLRRAATPTRSALGTLRSPWRSWQGSRLGGPRKLVSGEGGAGDGSRSRAVDMSKAAMSSIAAALFTLQSAAARKSPVLRPNGSHHLDAPLAVVLRLPERHKRTRIALCGNLGEHPESPPATRAEYRRGR